MDGNDAPAAGPVPATEGTSKDLVFTALASLRDALKTSADGLTRDDRERILTELQRCADEMLPQTEDDLGDERLSEPSAPPSRASPRAPATSPSGGSPREAPRSAKLRQDQGHSAAAGGGESQNGHGVEGAGGGESQTAPPGQIGCDERAVAPDGQGARHGEQVEGGPPAGWASEFLTSSAWAQMGGVSTSLGLSGGLTGSSVAPLQQSAFNSLHAASAWLSELMTAASTAPTDPVSRQSSYLALRFLSSLCSLVAKLCSLPASEEHLSLLRELADFVRPSTAPHNAGVKSSLLRGIVELSSLHRQHTSGDVALAQALRRSIAALRSEVQATLLAVRPPMLATPVSLGCERQLHAVSGGGSVGGAVVGGIVLDRDGLTVGAGGVAGGRGGIGGGGGLKPAGGAWKLPRKPTSLPPRRSPWNERGGGGLPKVASLPSMPPTSGLSSKSSAGRLLHFTHRM